MDEENKEVVEENSNASVEEKKTSTISLSCYIGMMSLFVALIVIGLMFIVQILKGSL